MKKKRIIKKKKLKKELKPTSGIVPVLFIIVLLGLFSETVRTLPAGAFSEKFKDMPFEIPRLNSDLVEEKLLYKADYRRINKEIIFKRTSKKETKIEQDIQNIQTEISEIESKKIDQKKEIVIAKIPEEKNN